VVIQAAVLPMRAMDERRRAMEPPFNISIQWVADLCVMGGGLGCLLVTMFSVSRFAQERVLVSKFSLLVTAMRQDRLGGGHRRPRGEANVP
jgi:hypothetical protein